MTSNIKELWRTLSYKELFSIDEIENSKILKILFYVISLSFFVTFFTWVGQTTISVSSFVNGSHICPPYFKTCGNSYFLESLPLGYSQSLFYVILFSLLVYGVISALKNNWVAAHKVILLTLSWKIIYIFALTYGVGGNFDYYDMGLAFVWVFLRKKVYFAKVLFVVYYFAASTIKIDEGWIFGNYFTATIIGAPFFSNEILPFFTNIVITMQIVGCWFLLSNNRNIQRLAFGYFLLFHVYSGIIVNYRYITIAIPALIILFGHNVNLFRIEHLSSFSILKIDRKTLAGYVLILFILVSQITVVLIPGNQKKTLEGNYYGLYMFEANHQCLSTSVIHYANKIDPPVQTSNKMANYRCDPYWYWYHLKTLCDRNKKITKISWNFDHSINGHSFERIVSEDNACNLNYNNLQHNTWLKLDGESLVLSDPVYKNGFGGILYPENHLIKTAPVISKYTNTIVTFYWLLWILTLVSIVFIMLKENRSK